MKRDRERDQTIDHLLRRRQPDGDAATPAEVCLEPHVMAAWMEGSLRQDEVAAAEAHAARCARCQSVLAALARTEPAVAALVPRRLSLTLRWLLPLATATAAVAVWIAVSPSDRPAAPAAPVASRSVAQEGQVTAPPEAAAPSAAPIDRGQARSRSVAASKTVSDRRDEKTERPPERSPTSAPALAPNDRAGVVGQTIDAVSSARERSAGAQAAARAGGGGGTAPPAAAAPSSTLAESLSARAFVAGAVAAPIEVVSPDPAFRWRVRTDGTVERTVDGGITWDLQPSATLGPVRAGSSPSSQVCWLAGRTGFVLRSTDGRTWQRVAFPETVDLVSIRATDANHATVSTADGRRFTTADGGVTWSEIR